MKIEYFYRNKTLLADKYGYRKPAKANSVNLNWWHIDYKDDIQNLGDMLSEVVFDYMCEYYSLDKDKKTLHTRHLYTIGSILFFENQDATIWGSGSTERMERSLHNIIHQRFMRRIDVRCVRGPKTRDNLLRLGIACPQIYGDPAMLLPLIYKPGIEKSSKDALLISHFQDKGVLKKNNLNINTMDMLTTNWNEKIDLIASAKMVISSSLHGIILAESYGVPAILLDVGNRDLFKYYDYYEGTGRKKIPVVKTIEEGLHFNFDGYIFPDVKTVQKNLLDSFPVDLWK